MPLVVGVRVDVKSAITLEVSGKVIEIPALFPLSAKIAMLFIKMCNNKHFMMAVNAINGAQAVGSEMWSCCVRSGR